MIGSYLGPYRLDEVIGRGSTSTVYQAYQRSLNRFVAIKVLLPSLDPQFTARFEHEAQLVAQLQHPNILPIYDYGQQDNRSYFVMQFIPAGRTVAHLMASGPIDPQEAVRLIIPTLDGLQYAHSKGVIHRDIKPSNILLPAPAWPMLADWGIAKVTYDDRHLTPPGQTVGTAVYMAPERAKGLPADPRTDIYGIGVVLFEMLTGRVPFDGPTPMNVLSQHVSQEPPAPRSLNADLPPALEAVVLQALAKNPAQRFQQAGEMAAALQQVVFPVPAAPVSQATPAPAATVTPTGYETNKLGPLPAPAASPAGSTSRRPLLGGRLATVARRVAAVALVLAILGTSALLLVNQRQHVVAQSLDHPTVAATGGQATTAVSTVLQTSAAGDTGTALTTTSPDVIQTAGTTAGLDGIQTEVAAATTTTAAPPAATLLVLTVPTPFPAETDPPPAAPPATPAPTDLITAAPAVQPTREVAVVVPSPLPPPPTSAPPRPTPTTAPAPATRGGTTLPAGPLVGRIEDTEWTGGYVRTGHAPFKGHTATWVYGANTPYHTMTTAPLLPLAGRPSGTATFRIYGMDSEGAAKAHISIRINGYEIYNGADPLPDDTNTPGVGNWGSYGWTFDAALLQNGPNTISISNLSPGQVGLPPWCMLDYAELAFTAP